MKKWIMIILMVLAAAVLIFFNGQREDNVSEDVSHEQQTDNISLSGNNKKAVTESLMKKEIDLDLDKYKVKAIDKRGMSEELAIGDDNDKSLNKLAEDMNSSGESDGKGDYASIKLPPKVKKMADQLKDMVDAFDEATLQTTKTALNNIPYVEAEPSKARIRMSGDRVTLKVNIPAEDIKIGRQ